MEVNSHIFLCKYLTSSHTMETEILLPNSMRCNVIIMMLITLNNIVCVQSALQTVCNFNTYNTYPYQLSNITYSRPHTTMPENHISLLSNLCTACQSMLLFGYFLTRFIQYSICIFMVPLSRIIRPHDIFSSNGNRSLLQFFLSRRGKKANPAPCPLSSTS